MVVDNKAKHQILVRNKDEILRLYIEDGLDTRNIGERFGFSKTAVANFLRKNGVLRESGKPSVDLDSGTIIKLYSQDNKTINEIAKLLGTTKRRISKLLKSNDIFVHGNRTREYTLTCVDCLLLFKTKSPTAKNCIKCRQNKSRLRAKQRWRRARYGKIHLNDPICVKCDSVINDAKLDRKYCDECRVRDCSYLKHMEVLLDTCEHKCGYCGDKVCKSNPPTIDHMVPLSRGGSNDLDNLTIACVSCNAKKGTKTHIEWRRQLT